MAIKKSFRKRAVRRIRQMLSPKEAEEILHQEFEDSRGNKHQFNLKFQPHLPNKEGDIKVRYKQGDNE